MGISAGCADKSSGYLIAGYPRSNFPSCCWLVKAEDDLEFLLEVVRRGEPLPDGHPLITARRDLDEYTRQVSAALASSEK
jgi:hypothetical protein